MSNDDQKQPDSVPPIPVGESARRSGEGASTALEALIRKRKQVETPADAETPDPIPPVPPASCPSSLSP